MYKAGSVRIRAVRVCRGELAASNCLLRCNFVSPSPRLLSRAGVFAAAVRTVRMQRLRPMRREDEDAADQQQHLTLEQWLENGVDPGHIQGPPGRPVAQRR